MIKSTLIVPLQDQARTNPGEANCLWMPFAVRVRFLYKSASSDCQAVLTLQGLCVHVKGDVAIILQFLLQGLQCPFDVLHEVPKKLHVVKSVIFFDEALKQASQLLVFDKKSAAIFWVHIKAACFSVCTYVTVILTLATVVAMAPWVFLAATASTVECLEDCG